MGDKPKQDGIYWRNGIAYGRVYVNGVEHRRSLRTRDATKAAIEYERLKQEVLNPAVEQPPELDAATFKQAVVAWKQLIYDAPAHEGLKQKSRDGYLNTIRILASKFAEYRLEQITHRAIGEWVIARREGKVVVGQKTLRPVTNATIRRDLSALSSVFTATNALGIYDQNPAATWNRKVIPESRAPFYVPTLAEIEAVAERASPSFAAVIRFAAYTGCRQTEAVRLKWRDVRLERGEARFLHTKTKRPRVISLSSPGGDATAAVKAVPKRIGVELVFWDEAGEAHREASKKFSLLVKALALEAKEAKRPFTRFTFHKLRHAFAIRWLEQGGSIYALSKHLGHTSVQTTEIYLSYIRAGLDDEWGDTAEEAAETEAREMARAAAQEAAQIASRAA